MQKEQLRKIIRERKRQFSSDELAELSFHTIKRLFAIPQFRRAQTILLYYSLNDEVDTHRLIEYLSSQSNLGDNFSQSDFRDIDTSHDMTLPKKILLPKVIGEQEMELREYTCEGDLAEGSFGIKEPSGRIFSDYEKIDCAVIPGMAFDRHNNRLGRGKGYYDRLLSKFPAHVYKIGVSFDFQKFETIPSEPTDIKMDAVV